MKKLLCLLTTAVLLLSIAPVSIAEEESMDAKASLVGEVTQTAVSYLATDDGDLYMYRDMNWSSIADTLPAKFDLRDRGVVPEIRDQGTWGTCWGFASIAAVETSALSSLNITAEKFAELTGTAFDLSEKHLGWFGTSHLPTLDQYAEGEYPYMESQAGEGEWSSIEDTDPNKAHYFANGKMAFAAGIFANGIGPSTEQLHPYTANDGSDSTTADWSIDDSARFEMFAELKSSNILPSPALRDENGSYYYNAAGTEAIKKELLAGRGVSIAYHPDHSLAPEVFVEGYTKQFMQLGMPEVNATLLSEIAVGVKSPYELDEDGKKQFLTAVLYWQGAPADSITDERLENAMSNYDYIVPGVLAALDSILHPQTENTVTAEQEEQLRTIASMLGRDYDAYMAGMAKTNEAGTVSYINMETWAQYNDNQYAPVSHAVTIIGWDDDYAVENFPADHQPPAPGAWIVRNSWGSSYGIDGYFYLSYYDETIIGAETFEFVYDRNAFAGGVKIMSYDYMQASAVSSVQVETPVYSANIFPVNEDAVLNYVSVMTADLNAKVTVAVYLLNKDYTSPVDGVLLDTVTADFEFGGYHRIELNHAYQLPAGSRISVVQKQGTQTTNGLRYTLPFTNAKGKEAVVYSKLLSLSQSDAINWFVGVIGEGESFVCVDNNWYDWKDIVNEVREGNSIAALLEFDNMNIKAYFYTVDGVHAAHKFGPAQQSLGAEAYICEECGDTLIVVK